MFAIKPAPRMGLQYATIANSGNPVSYKIVIFFGFSKVLKALGYALQIFFNVIPVEFGRSTGAVTFLGFVA